MTITIVRTSGAEEQFEIERHNMIPTIAHLIGARTIEAVRLRNSGRIMLIDEDGYEVELVERPPPPGYSFAMERVPVRALKPVNLAATALYHAICVAGTTHQIVGDVALLQAADFDDDEDEP